MTVTLIGAQNEGAVADFTPRFDLTPAEMHDRTQEFMATRALPLGRFVLARVHGTEPFADVARTLVQNVFDEPFGNGPELMQREYTQYEPATNYLVVMDREPAGAPAGTSVVAGALGFTHMSSAGFKTMNDIAKPENLDIPVETARKAHGINMNTCVDIGTLAVTKGYRGSRTGLKVSTMLYRGMFLFGEQEGITDVLNIIAPEAYHNVKRLGIPCEPIAGSRPFEYLGAKGSVATHGYFPDFRPKVTAQAEKLERLSRIGELFSKVTGLRPKALRHLKLGTEAIRSLVSGEGLDEHMAL